MLIRHALIALTLLACCAPVPARGQCLPGCGCARPCPCGGQAPRFRSYADWRDHAALKRRYGVPPARAPLPPPYRVAAAPYPAFRASAPAAC